MPKIGFDKKASPMKATGSEAASGACSFEGTLVSIAGSRVVVKHEPDKQTTYAIASDALLTCDGKIGNEESLEAGRRIRVTTQNGNANMVTGIEWLNTNKTFPAPKTAAAK